MSNSDISGDEIRVNTSNSNGDVTCHEYSATSDESAKITDGQQSDGHDNLQKTSSDEEEHSTIISNKPRYISRRKKRRRRNPYIVSRNRPPSDKHSSSDMIVSSILASNGISAKKCREYYECGFDIYKLFVGIAEYILGSTREKEFIIQKQLNRFLKKCVLDNPNETMRAITYLRTRAVKDYVERRM